MTTQEQQPDVLADHLTTQLHRRRVLQLGHEVDDGIANRVCAQLVLLAAEDPRRDILLMINSPGGLVSPRATAVAFAIGGTRPSDRSGPSTRNVTMRA